MAAKRNMPSAMNHTGSNPCAMLIQTIMIAARSSLIFDRSLVRLTVMDRFPPNIFSAVCPHDFGESESTYQIAWHTNCVILIASKSIRKGIDHENSRRNFCVAESR
jgi:hypothetical protein